MRYAAIGAGLVIAFFAFVPSQVVASSRALAAPATFTGREPCADCSGIRVVLTLGSNHRYAMVRRYAGKGSLTQSGTWAFDAENETLALQSHGAPNYYRFMPPGKLVPLDRYGDPIVGAPIDMSLNESSGTVPSQTQAHGSLGGPLWNLSELGGKPVAVPAGETVPSLQFDPSKNHVSGSTGCNRLMGGYKASGESLTFEPLATTMMACEPAVSSQETAFLKALGKVHAYSVSGSSLELLDTSGVVLARFHASH